MINTLQIIQSNVWKLKNDRYLFILFVSILRQSHSYFCSYCRISRTALCTPSLSLTVSFISRHNLAVHERCLNFVCDDPDFLKSQFLLVTVIVPTCPGRQTTWLRQWKRDLLYLTLWLIDKFGVDPARCSSHDAASAPPKICLWLIF